MRSHKELLFRKSYFGQSIKKYQIFYPAEINLACTLVLLRREYIRFALWFDRGTSLSKFEICLYDKNIFSWFCVFEGWVYRKYNIHGHIMFQIFGRQETIIFFVWPNCDIWYYQLSHIFSILLCYLFPIKIQS